ncbi:hypothetical protein AMAG_03099 [Allomyces macrogynus ATCC 38327]|uniref:Protein SDA1 n=1 Tax=Allomyces macrogynus (strain ATCC 38327) TaxID=578462 RepID=A0A0L0S4D5_ALLM3|nr:hypothetical protein AMAG_03099 [Allomyces macrogynus ATCC 38327]|eukprot:KNE57377.1 hypothetical protein AMAG_03099 [Allomyces macrogynus ATCC 38327]
MGRQRNREASLATNLPQLQNLIKRDPPSYLAEFLQQLRHLDAQLLIVARAPHLAPHKSLPELLSFISHTVPCYHATQPDAAKVPTTLLSLLQTAATVMHPDLRKALVSALIMLHNKNVLDSQTLLPPFFLLFRCKDKVLRETLHTFIIQDIKTANQKHKNNKLNKAIQNMLYSVLTPPPGYKPPSAAQTAALATAADDPTGFSPVAASKSLQICIELYKKQIWNDTKTVNVIAEACFSPILKIMTMAVHFFIGADKKDGEDGADDADSDTEETVVTAQDVTKAHHTSKITKKSRANARKLRKMVAAHKRSVKSSDTEKDKPVQFSALQVVYDPQTFAEKLFAQVKGGHFAFETKLLLLNLISRLIASHKLFILSFYTYLQKYLQPHQRNVTSLLAYTAQASHDLVPPDVLAPVIRVIADQFVNEHSSREVISAGLNAIREICTRAPLAMDADLLSDLVQYKNHRDKSVIMAARSLIGLFREVNPSLLPKNERGKTAAMQMQAGHAPSVEFGRVVAASRVAGAELLEELSGDEMMDDDDDAAWEGWAVESDEDSSEGEWMDVPEDGIELSDWSDSSSDSESDEDDDEAPEAINEADLDAAAVGSDAESDEEVDSDDEEEEEEEEEGDEDPNARLPIEARKFLTPADFAKMAQLRATQSQEPTGGKNKRKRAAAHLADNEPSSYMAAATDFVDEDSLVPLRKKPKSDYEERMASIAAGREGREKYGSRKGKKAPGQSTSNTEKRRTKLFTMVSKSRKVSSKKKASLRDKTATQRKHIQRQKIGKATGL